MSWPAWGDNVLWFLFGMAIGTAVLGPLADWLDSPGYRAWREERWRERRERRR